MRAEPDGGRRLTRRGQVTYDRIVAAASEVMAQRGVAETTTEHVRRAAGVGGSQLYHYFENKQALVRAVITRQADLAVLAGTTPDLGPLDSFEAFEAWADAAVARIGQNGGRGDCTLSTLAGELAPSADEQSRAELSDGFLRWKGLLEDGLARMRDRGELREDTDVVALSYALLAALQGGTLLSTTLRNADAARAAMDAAMAYLRSHAA